jgi:hypothetical protein
MMRENEKSAFLNTLYGNWKSIDSKVEKYHLSITSTRFSLGKLDDGKEVESDSFEYLSDFDMGVKYRIRGGKSTYGVLSLSSEALVLSRGVGEPGFLQFEEIGRFSKVELA